MPLAWYFNIARPGLNVQLQDVYLDAITTARDGSYFKFAFLQNRLQRRVTNRLLQLAQNELGSHLIFRIWVQACSLATRVAVDRRWNTFSHASHLCTVLTAMLRELANSFVVSFKRIARNKPRLLLSQSIDEKLHRKSRINVVKKSRNWLYFEKCYCTVDSVVWCRVELFE